MQGFMLELQLTINISSNSHEQTSTLSSGNNNKYQAIIPTNNGDANEAATDLPSYQSIFANSLTRQKQHQEPITVSPITRIENGHSNSSQQNGKVQQNNNRNSATNSPYTPQ